MDVSDNKWQSKWSQERTVEEYKCVSFTMETVSEYKYQIVIETVEQNTSKQVSAKETALQNTSKHSIFFFKTEWV